MEFSPEASEHFIERQSVILNNTTLLQLHLCEGFLYCGIRINCGKKRIVLKTAGYKKKLAIVRIL